MQNFRALGAPPPHPRASGGWGLCPQTPSLRRLGAEPPDPHWPPAAGGGAPRPPKQPPPLRISGYAPDCTNVLNATDHTPDVQLKQSYCLQPNLFKFIVKLNNLLVIFLYY